MAISSIFCVGRMSLIVAGVALASTIAVAQEERDEHSQCASHLWGAGVQLGKADAIAHHDSAAEDGEMFEAMHEAGVHVEKANALCPQHPAPWPAWRHWRGTQERLAEMAKSFRKGQISRHQLAVELYAVEDSLAWEVAVRVTPKYIDRDTTCEAIYAWLGHALSYAQTETRLSGRLTRDAATHLRHGISFIYQTRETLTPCLDFMTLAPAINAALKNPEGAAVDEQVGDILHAGDKLVAPPN